MQAVCSICRAQFEPHFRYQREDRIVAGPDQRPRREQLYFCSQRCLEASHTERIRGSVACDTCGQDFQVELAAQVVFAGGRRHYVCQAACRTELLNSLRSQRLSEFLDPQKQPEAEDEAVSALLGPVQASEKAQRPTAPVAVPLQPVTQGAISRAKGSEDRGSSQSGRPGSGAPRVIAVFNHKGGTGKTTTAVSVAAGLAERGQRVLLVDTDGQGNVAVSLGLKFERSLYHVLVMGLDPKSAVISARPSLDVLPANETLAAAELYLAGRRQRDRILAERLSKIREDYDFVIVDCSPSLSLMNQNALVMADAVLCPVACDYLAIVGVRQVLRTVRHVNQLLHHPVRFWGVLPTLFDGRARICREALETLQEHFKQRCLSPVRASIRVKEAPAQGKTLFEYAPHSSATADYLSVVDRLLLGQQEALDPTTGVCDETVSAGGAR